ncbi:MAG: GNAT family N-acetyltransferase [Acidimicrobiales bacterium]
MLIRTAVEGDAEALLEIYNLEVLTSTVTMDLVPRDLDTQRRYLAERSGGLAVLVAEIDAGEGEGPEIVGFASLSFYRDRPAYRTSVENSVYVHRGHQRRGVGSALLGALLERASAHGFHAVFARIAGPQEASLALHRAHGYELVGIEREVGRKFGQWHDVAVMQRLL